MRSRGFTPAIMFRPPFYGARPPPSVAPEAPSYTLDQFLATHLALPLCSQSHIARPGDNFSRIAVAIDLPPIESYVDLRTPTDLIGETPMSYRSGPREQGRYRVRHGNPADRLYSSAEMAELLGIHKDTLWKRLRARDPTIPPAFQPRGPGTAWKFSERSYLQWLALQTERKHDGH